MSNTPRLEYIIIYCQLVKEKFEYTEGLTSCRRTDNTMTKRNDTEGLTSCRRTDNTMTKRKDTEGLTSCRRTDNTMTKRTGTKQDKQ